MTMDIATLGIRVDATEARLAAIELEKLSTAGGKTAKAMSSVEKSMQGLTGLFAGLGLGALAKSVLDTNREMESLRASLKSVMGSAQGAQGAFNAILTFAKDTPFEIKGLTQTFIALQNMGIKPTHQVMQALTDQASKLGGSQETLTSIALQLGQAHSKGKLQMEDMVVLMERGVPVMKLLGQVTGKNAAELADMSAKGTITVDMIDKLIVKMGEAAAGSNANAMETLNGKISSLSDAWHSFEDTLLNDKSEGYLKTVVSNWTAWLDYFKDSIAGVGKEFLALEEINNKIVSSKAKISAMSQGGISGAAWQVAGALTGNSIEGEKNRLSDFIKQREGVIKTTHDVIVAKNQETAATDKLLNSTNEEKKALEQTLQSKKEQEKAAKAAAREQAALAKAFEDTVTSLSLHNIELSKTPRQLEEATLASKGLNKAMIAQAMALWDVGKALEAKKQLNEQEKSQLDSLIDRYNKATMSARDYYSSTLTVTGPDGIKSPMSGADKAPLLSQFDKTSKAELDKKSIDDAKTALDAYNSSLDSANSKTSDLSAVTSAIFDGALAGINGMAGAFDSMVNSIDSATQSLAKNSEAQTLNNAQADSPEKTANATKYAQVELDLNDKVLNAKLKAGSQIAGFLSSSLKKGSTEQKAAHAIQMALAGAELAMNIMKVLGIGRVAEAETESVLPSVAASTAKGTAKAAEAVATQATAGPYIGFALMAAMAAAMAAIGFATGGGGGSSVPPPSDTGTGTVLGDPTAVSESVGKTNELLKTIHASEYVELRGINRGVNNLQQGISNTVSSIFRNGGLTTVTLAPESLAGLGAVWSKVTGAFTGFDPVAKFIGNFLFGGKVTRSVVGQGISTGATSLESVIGGGNVSAYQYADIQTKRSGGLFTKAKTKYSTQYAAIGEDTQKALNQVFSSIGETMVSVAKTLGKDLGINLEKSVMDAVIPAMRVDLKGLNGEDAAKKLNGVISATLDTMSVQLFGSIVGKYQRLGEGMLETTIRIVAEIAIVKDALNQSGLSLTTNIVAVSDALVQAAGGLEAFQAQFESFFDKFYTDAEKQARLAGRLYDTFAELFPESTIKFMGEARANYRKVMEALDMSTLAGQAHYSMLIELASASDTYYSGLEANAKAAMDTLTKSVSSAMSVLQKAVAAEKTALTKAYNDNIASTQAVIATLTASVTKLTSLSNMLKNSLKSMSVAGSEATNRATAQAFITDALRMAQSGKAGSIDETQLNDALGVVAKPSELLFATFEDYQRDFLKTAISVSNLSDALTSEKSKAVSQLDVAKSQLEVLKDTYTAENLRLDEIIRSAQEQIDAVNGTTVAVMTVTDAIVNLTAAILAMKQMQTPTAKTYKEGATATGYQSGGGASYDNATKNISFIDNTVFTASQVVKSVTDAIASGHTEQVYAAAIAKGVSAVSLDLLMGWPAGTSNNWAIKNNLPRFATGGQHEGGWRIVGENGPELEKTGASRIFSNPQSKSLLSMDELIAEMKALRADVRAGQEAIATYTRKTAKILQDVTQDGTAITTVVAV